MLFDESVLTDLDQADADTDIESLLVPAEGEVADGRAQTVGDFFCLPDRAVEHQYAEFVAAQSGQAVAGADAVRHQVGDLFQQLVTGQVSAGVIHDFELIEVEVTDRMRPVLVPG